MEYFLMMPDERIGNRLKIQPDTVDFETTEACSVYADFKEDTVFVDYLPIRQLFRHAFYVSDDFKELLDLYSDKLNAFPVFITDKNQKGQKVYWRVAIELADCVVKEQNMNYASLTLNKNGISGKHIFRIAFEKQEYLIVSLNLAETILRKEPAGIRFFSVKLQEENNE
ncbi:hypothetical protein [Lacrimispora amygdalina]|uniref:hypothetical protein n=1 Tax=Lacrimispora amygdalina TaxID=253257 RepID=UPI000BE4434E|nr:hypothetical protein [Lacrimispora amygdalina]